MMKLSYRIVLEDGGIFESSEASGGPISLPADDLGFPEEVMTRISTLRPGQEVRVKLPPEKAYGVRDEELVFSVPRGKLPERAALQFGAVMRFVLDESEELLVTVIGNDGQVVTLDANHPLAGQSVVFELIGEEE
ncbi:FKBP-type peptidyl-prolyl cis-trans isomerase [bacterium]|nr:FKBP-type peptidyl-prolyl cis-trans isomerase [bacterium]